MKLLIVMAIWMLMAAVLVGGVVMAVQGSLWLLCVGFLAFVLAIAKIGCLTH
jgi:hypothetical protein